MANSERFLVLRALMVVMTMASLGVSRCTLTPRSPNTISRFTKLHNCSNKCDLDSFSSVIGTLRKGEEVQPLCSFRGSRDVNWKTLWTKVQVVRDGRIGCVRDVRIDCPPKERGLPCVTNPCASQRTCLF